MLEIATNVTWQETTSEIEALILESQLIKKHKPQFNVMLRDDKQYFYVSFTNDKFPRIYLTHQPQFYLPPKISNDKFQITNQIPSQNVKIKHSEKNWKLEIGNWKLNSAEAEFLGPFTDGSAIKTTLRLLRRIFPYCTCKQKHNNYCLNYHIENCPGFCCLKQQNLNFQKEYLKNINAIKDILTGKRANLIEKLKKEMLVFGKKHNFEKAIELRTKITKLEKVFQNAQIIANYEERSASLLTLKELKKILKLPNLPRRIEGYDISNIQGTFSTGSMVVFINGQSDNKQYRQFKINTITSSNDTAMLNELLTRRFNHPEWPYPDLILVDGGKGQLNSVRSVISNEIKKIKYKIPIIALTKNARHQGSHIFLGNKKMPILLKNMPTDVKNLILQIDAEAHRFAINYYKKLHSRSLKQ